MSGSSVKVKNKIKSGYYLVSNGHLHHERFAIYQAVAKPLLSGKSQIDVPIDWSPCATHENQILKASVILRGRSITLYEEVHPEKKLGNYKVQQDFLKRLKLIIPQGIQVTVVTDAGFRTDWFSQVKALGWDFLGRIRSNMLFKRLDETSWLSCTAEYQFAR